MNEKYYWRVVFIGDEGTKKAIKVEGDLEYTNAVKKAWKVLDTVVPKDCVEVFDIVLIKRLRQIWD